MEKNQAVSSNEATTYDYYNEYYPNIQRIREQNASVSDTIRAKNEVDLAFDAAGENLKSGSKVLDCPCGLGYQADSLAKKGLEVTAIDGSDSNIAFANSRPHDGNVNFKQGLFKDLPNLLKPESQDTICCFRESFCYEPSVSENVEHLKSMFDILKQGGKMVLTWDLTPSYYRNGREKDEIGKIREKKGMDKDGREIKYYTKSIPTQLSDQVVPDEYIPESGFSNLKGDSPQAIENRTVRSYGNSQSVYVDNEGNEHISPSFELREYFKPVFENHQTNVNALLGDSGEFYDIPLVRALCEHVGFENVKCIPARKLDNESWTVGIVATKPSLQSLNNQIEETRGQVENILKQ